MAFTILNAQLFGLGARCLRVTGDRIAAIGGPGIARPGDTLVDGAGGTLLPGLIDTHVHLLPGATALAAAFGVTTLIDQFSKPDVLVPERAAVAEGRADLRSSGIGATAPGGHPSLAYAPFPTLSSPGEAEQFVEDRLAEGSDHLKIVYDDGSSAMLDIPSLDPPTITALVEAAHARGLKVVAHASTAAGAVVVSRCGVDVLAHAPFDRMSDREIAAVARTGVALIATLAVIDGFPSRDGGMPLLAQPELAARLSPRWRRVLNRQALRWMPPQPPDGAAARYNTMALHESGVRVLAGTDAPNPGLVFGASLHRELQHLVEAGLRPIEALTAATSTPADVFDLPDRGRLTVGSRADLLLVDGDPTKDITATQRIRQTWAAGRQPTGYAGSAEELAGVVWLRKSTAKIVQAIRELWPDFPGPEEVRRDDDGELLGHLVPVADGWLPMTTFGVALGPATPDREDAEDVVRRSGLAALADRWWARIDGPWAEATLVEAQPDRVRLHWSDPMTEQPPAGQWYDLADLDLSLHRPDCH